MNDTPATMVTKVFAHHEERFAPVLGVLWGEKITRKLNKCVLLLGRVSAKHIYNLHSKIIIQIRGSNESNGKST